MLHLALFEPEIPQNAGTLIRFGACMGVRIHIIEPCGFIFADKNLLRAGMDYIDLAAVERHTSWDSFAKNIPNRKILVDPSATTAIHDFTFCDEDVMLLGKESSGFPEAVKQSISEHVKIPMLENRRSLNVALAGGIVATEALRQTNLLP